MPIASRAVRLTSDVCGARILEQMPTQTRSYPVDTRFQKPNVSQTARLEALRHVGLFQGVSKRSLVLIDRLSVVRTVLPGEVLVAEGDTGSDMMVVLDGKASVTRGTRKLTELSVGQAIGEMALLDNQPRSATVTALEPMRILAINGPAFRKLLSKVPGLTEALLATLCSRLREANAADQL
jgi:CRP/FNR family transcriptional regulator, cyclic AMP receptor protein